MTTMDKVEGTERILFIDDEENLIEIVRHALTRYGYKVTSFSDSIRAWKHFLKNPYSYDLVVTDMTMPKMTGDLLAKKILSLRKNIPIIICTGFSEVMDENKAKALGFKAFLYKPISVKTLLETIRNVLDEEANH